MQDWSHIIKVRWPDGKNSVSENLKPYFNYGDGLSLENGIILKGPQILIPKHVCKKTKTKLHAALLGYENMVCRTREALFWPDMTIKKE